MLLDGKALAARLRADLQTRVTVWNKGHAPPKLCVLRVGENPASEVYVRNKAKAAIEAGLATFDHKLPVDTDEATLLARAEVVAEDGDDPHGQGGGRGLLFLEPSRDRRAAIARYVKERLALHLS